MTSKTRSIHRPKSIPKKVIRISWKDGLLAVLSGILLILIFPSFDLETLAWVALVPLLWILGGKGPRQAFWVGGITGLTFYLGTLHWVTNTMVNYGHLPLPVSLLILLLLALYLAAYVALFALLFAHLGQATLGLQWIGAPLVWTTLELVRAHLLSGFPWASLGYSQYKALPLIQIAEVTGVYGVSFLIVWVNATLALLLVALRNPAPADGPAQLRGRSKPRSSLALKLAAPLVALSLCLAYGSWRLKSGESALKEGSSQKVRAILIQGNIEQDRKWDRRYQEEVFALHRELTLAAARAPADLIVWPEASTPFFFQSDDRYRPQTFALAGQSGAPLLFGSPAYRLNRTGVEMFNRAYLISPQGMVLGQYDKIHLVPFGEYVPLQRMLPFVHRMVEGIGDFAAGKEFTLMSIPQGRFGVLICFESIFPELARRFVLEGAQFLVNITNDAWFGRSPAPYQHMSMVPFRAIENRVPVIRAANTGVSGLFDPWGRILQQSDIFVQTWLRGEISPKDPREGLTFYTRHGDLFAYLCALCAIVLFGIRARRRFGR